MPETAPVERAAGRPGEWRRAAIVLLGAAAFGVAFALFARLMLYHFYLRGSFLLDSGLLGAVMWRDDAALNLPPSLGGESFFVFHVAPVLLLVGAVGHALALSMPQVFAGFVGLAHGLLAAAIYWLLVDGYGMRRGWMPPLAALASVAFAASGLAIAIARYPHFETFGAACLLLCLVGLVLDRPIVAGVAFGFALATREDLGLHAFGFLVVWLALNRLRGTPWRSDRRLLGFALAGLLYSVLALLAQHLAFPGHSSFARVYLGDPPYAHLTARLVTSRLLGWAYLHAGILATAAAAGLWAVRARNPYTMLGYVACLPWALLHLFAASDLAGWMVGYYGFPFLIAMAWPLLAGLIKRRQGTEAAGLAWMPAMALLGLVAIGLLPIGRDYDPGRIAIPDAFLRAPSLALQRSTDRAVAAIAAARPLLGTLEVDNSIAALAPFAFPRGEVAGWAEGTPDTLVYLAEGFDAARMTGATHLPSRYRVPGTEVRIDTDRPPETMRALGIPLDETP
jgi:hypothetical protein